jgi:hypothetical protein
MIKLGTELERMRPYCLVHIHWSGDAIQILSKTKKASCLIGQSLGAAQESHIKGLMAALSLTSPLAWTSCQHCRLTLITIPSHSIEPRGAQGSHVHQTRI